MQILTQENQVFPPEIWHLIFGLVNCKKDWKCISQVSKLFHELVKDHLWNFHHIKGDVMPPDLERLRHLPIRKLHVTFYRFREDANEWLRVIGQFTELTYLHFERVPKDNNHIRRESIFLQLDDFALSNLTSLVNLKELSVKWLHPGKSAGVASLIHLPIENLYLENWSAGSVGIAMAIGRMKLLKKLEFSASKECFRYLSALHNLKELKTLNTDCFSLQELMYIAHLPLELLDISGCTSFLEDEMFELMREMKTLKTVLMFGCKFNHYNIRRLQQAIPKLHVGWRKLKERTKKARKSFFSCEALANV